MSSETKTDTYDQRVVTIHKLRVNVKSLSAESRIIRKEAERAGSVFAKWQLSAHRRGRLREEARIAHLALAYVRGRAYRDIESCHAPPLLLSTRIGMKLAKNGTITVCDSNARYLDIERWLQEPVQEAVEQQGDCGGTSNP